MTGNVESLILEMLRGLRNQVEGLQTEMRNEFRDVKQRLGSVESAVIGVRRDEIAVSGDIARQQSNLDQLVERIERRLEIVTGK